MRWPHLGPGDWRGRGRLTYLRPIGWGVHGVLAETSGTAGSIYVWHVAVPLTVPVEVLDLSWSERVGGGAQTYVIGTVEADDALLEGAARAKELHLRNPILLDPPGGADNVRMQEARAYGLLVSGDLASASEVIGRVLRHRPSYEWEHEIIDRAQRMDRLLDAGEWASALDVVQGWRTTSLEMLGLDE